MTATDGNCGRFAAAPLAGGGTPTSTWLGHPGLRDLPALDVAEIPGLVIVAPHPDDETLGLGGLAATVAARGIDVDVVSVSDGGAAYPESSAFDRIHLEKRRRAELVDATTLLGVRRPIHLGLPDGELAQHAETMTELIGGILAERPGVWCAGVWRGDGHPDHEAVGRCAAEAAADAGATFLEYPVWMWHWARPGDPDVPWERAYSVPLSRAASGRKQHAIQCFKSQLHPPNPDAPPVVPAFAVRRLQAVGEVVFR